MNLKTWWGFGLLGILLSSCMRIYVYEGLPPVPKHEEKAEKTKKKTPYKPWEEVTKKRQRQEGFFTTYFSPDGKLLIEIPKERLDKDFALVMHIERGVGDLDILEGLPFSATQILRFHRAGDYLYLIRRNPRFSAGDEKTARHALEENVSHTLIARFEIQSEHPETKALLVQIDDFLVSDYPNFSRYKNLFEGGAPAMIRTLSYVEDVKNFPKNTEISVVYTLRLPGPPRWGGESLLDPRQITLALRWSFFALPENPMTPRLADERVGYFLTSIEDFSQDTSLTPIRHWIQRWRLEPQDPRLPLSPPKKPIVFYIDSSVPKRYRKYVHAGILAWNKAFEKAGFKDAIVVKDAPEDSTWSPEDIRYSTIRWTFAHRMGYAIGPSQVDPRTGEILNADILLDWSFIRSWVLDFDVEVDPLSILEEEKRIQQLAALLPSTDRQHLCTFMLGMRHQMAMAYLHLLTLGRVRPGEPLPESFIGAAIQDIVLHEVGHTLGLRHNFKASSRYPFEALSDTAFTHRMGIAASVMDYNPLNLMADHPHTDLFMTVVGPYDIHAIRYGYAPVRIQKGHENQILHDPLQEVDTLRSWASISDTTFLYGTDEETWGPYSIDPYTAVWDLGEDPVAYARNRHKIAEKILPRLEELFRSTPDGYRNLRIAFGVLLADRYYAYRRLVKYIGGLRMDRVKPSDRWTPFRLVPSSLQRQALREILDGLFPRSLPELSGNRILQLAPNLIDSWATPAEPPFEFSPIRALGTVYRIYLEDLLYPTRLNRLISIRYVDPSALSPDEVMESVESRLFSDLKNIPLHWMVAQDLYLRALIHLIYPSGETTPTPYVRATARMHLKSLASRLGDASKEAQDPLVRAHLAYLTDLAQRALEAQVEIPLRQFSSWYHPEGF